MVSTFNSFLSVSLLFEKHKGEGSSEQDSGSRNTSLGLALYQEALPREKGNTY